MRLGLGLGYSVYDQLSDQDERLTGLECRSGVCGERTSLPQAARRLNSHALLKLMVTVYSYTAAERERESYTVLWSYTVIYTV